MFERLRLQATILFGALRASGLRSFMVVVAVGIGSTSLMTMLAMSAGTRQRLEGLTEMTGRNMFMVRVGRSVLDTESSRLRARLTVADSAAVANEVADLQQVLPVLQMDVTVKLGGASFPTTLLGVTEPYFPARNWRRGSGRLLDDVDDAAMQRVAVVGAAVGRSLNAGGDLVGANLLIAGVPFEVVGQLREKGVGFAQSNEDINIYVPLRSSLRRLFNVEDISYLLVQARDRRGMASAERAVAAVLRREHNLPASSRDDFEILQLIRQNQVTTATNALVQGITRIVAVILLALGGIGVFAVTYLSIVQRSPEIGLRRALGAKQRDIAALFTSEACVLGALGGAFGCALGSVIVYGLGRWTEWAIKVEPQVVVVPLLISIVIGITFGVGPALRAARLPPVEALRGT